MQQIAPFQPAQRGSGFLPQVDLRQEPNRMGLNYGDMPFLGQVKLGQTAETWFQRARAALERFRFLKEQIQTVDNNVARDTIIAWLGSPNVSGTPEYRYATALQDFTFDASSAQEGVQAYAVSRRQNRVRDLESFNDQLNQRIESARVTYGTRPAPDVPTPTVIEGPDLTVPILVGAGAIVAALIFA